MHCGSGGVSATMNARHDAPRTQRERQRQFSHDVCDTLMSRFSALAHSCISPFGGCADRRCEASFARRLPLLRTLRAPAACQRRSRLPLTLRVSSPSPSPISLSAPDMLTVLESQKPNALSEKIPMCGQNSENRGNDAVTRREIQKSDSEVEVH